MRAVRSWFQLPAGVRDFLFYKTFQTGCWAHPAPIQFPLLQNIPDWLWGPHSPYSISSSPEHSRLAVGPTQPLFNFLFSRIFQTGSGAHLAPIQFPLLQNIPDWLWGPPSPYSISSSPEHSRLAVGPTQPLFNFLFSRTFQTGCRAHPAPMQFPFLQNIPDWLWGEDGLQSQYGHFRKEETIGNMLEPQHVFSVVGQVAYSLYRPSYRGRP